VWRLRLRVLVAYFFLLPTDLKSYKVASNDAVVASYKTNTIQTKEPERTVIMSTTIRFLQALKPKTTKTNFYFLIPNISANAFTKASFGSAPAAI
jgi:hypothetical protein